MHHPVVLDRVRLTQPVPTLWLDSGEIGIVRSVWFSSPVFYEVEFRAAGHSSAVRALLAADHLEVIASTEIANAPA